MRLSFLVVLLLAAVASAPLLAQKKIPSSEKRKFRTLFGKAMPTSPDDSKALKKLAAQAKRMGGRYPVSELRALLDEGPLVSAKLKPRRFKKWKHEEKHVRYETALTGLQFFLDGKSENPIAYAVDIPKGYDGKTPVPVFIDPGHGVGKDKDQKGKAGFLGYYRNMVDQAGGEDWLVVRTEIVEQLGAGGKRGQLPEDQVVPCFRQLRRDLASRFSIDCDEIHVAGLSQTGFWAWMLGRAEPQAYRAILPMGAVTWQVNQYLDNFRNLPVYVLHGEKDPICPVAQPRLTTGKMKERDLPVVYEEIAGGKHDFSTWGKLGTMLKQAQEKERVRFPKRITHRFSSAHVPDAYWVTAEDFESDAPGAANGQPIAEIDIRVEGQEIIIEKATGMRKLVIGLAPELVSFDEPVSIKQGKRLLWKGRPKVDFRTAVGWARERADWKAAPLAFQTVKIR